MSILPRCRPDAILFISLYPMPSLWKIYQNLGGKLLLVGFVNVLGNSVRPYSCDVLSVLDEEGETNLPSPKIHGRLGGLVFFDIQGIAHMR